jgi:hypothetical protein
MEVPPLRRIVVLVAALAALLVIPQTAGAATLSERVN